MAKDFVVTVREPEQVKRFQEVFHRTTVSVTSPMPETANLPGKGKTQIYLLDLECITPEERKLLVQNISERFGIPAAEVDSELNAHGVPILAEHCMMSVRNPQRYF